MLVGFLFVNFVVPSSVFVSFVTFVVNWIDRTLSA